MQELREDRSPNRKIPSICQRRSRWFHNNASDPSVHFRIDHIPGGWILDAMQSKDDVRFGLLLLFNQEAVCVGWPKQYVRKPKGDSILCYEGIGTIDGIRRSERTGNHHIRQRHPDRFAVPKIVRDVPFPLSNDEIGLRDARCPEFVEKVLRSDFRSRSSARLVFGKPDRKHLLAAGKRLKPLGKTGRRDQSYHLRQTVTRFLKSRSIHRRSIISGFSLKANIIQSPLGFVTAKRRSVNPTTDATINQPRVANLTEGNGGHRLAGDEGPGSAGSASQDPTRP